MADIFNEIDEDLRRDQYRKLWDKYGVLLLLTAGLIVAGVAGWRGYAYWQESRAASAGDRYYSALRQLESGDTAAASDALGKLAADGPAGYGVIARLQKAALVARDDRAAGIKAYEDVSRSTGLPKVLKDLALIQAAYLAVDTEDAKAVAARVQPFLAPGEAFRNSAREIIALSAIKADDWATAAKEIDEMQRDADLPQTFQQRLTVLDGVVKASTPIQPAKVP
jgi:hypothetical protein